MEQIAQSVGNRNVNPRVVGSNFRVNLISLWSASGVCALFALGVYFYTDTLGFLLIVVFASGWITALALFLRTQSQD
jgi:hypothetical protein